ncbi:ABC transporter permease [Salsipaludibacter albus]|uniref:ABC transporter permease n=1 Tax=Salsipaludibacter albus TaxID=2849650 RepID=UPI003084338D|nr:ABC transporter permease [Salsipaludibacter albus]
MSDQFLDGDLRSSGAEADAKRTVQPAGPGEGPSPDALLDKPTSIWRLGMRRFFRRKLGVLGLAIVTLLTLVALFAPVLAPYDPIQQLDRVEEVQRRDPPSSEHLLGLDSNARDQLSRIIWGARISLPLGVSIVMVAIMIGAAIGAIAGYFGGAVDSVLMRIMDVILGFPALLLAVAIAYVLGPQIRNVLIAVAVVTLPQYARVMRSSVLSIKEIDYVAASQALGASSWRMLRTRILPNSLTPLIVLGTLGIAGAILEAAALSFLGLGAQPPQPEWGAMLAQEYTLIQTYPHLVIYPGLAIMITVLGFNLLGDGLRDAFDPSLNE